MSLIVDQRKEATTTVIRWITDAHGDEVAGAWAWECTPMPCGLPSDEQLHEGVSLALGEITIGALLAKSYRAMDEAMAQILAEEKAAQRQGADPKGGAP